METSQKTKKCSHCGKELPIENFGRRTRSSDGYAGICKDCLNAINRKNRRLRKLGDAAPNPALKDFTPEELMSELKARGYHGLIEFIETKVHKIRL